MADYPSSQPTFDTPGSDLSDPEHSGMHEKTDEELTAALDELGLSPSGTWSTVRARLDSIETTTTSAKAGICVVNAPTQTATNNTYDVLTFSGTVDADPNAWLNAGAKSQIIPDVEGWYHVEFDGRMTGTASNFATRILKNGSTVAQQDHGVSGNPDFCVSTVVYCNGTTDYITVANFQDSGSGQDHSGRICVHWIAD